MTRRSEAVEQHVDLLNQVDDLRRKLDRIRRTVTTGAARHHQVSAHPTAPHLGYCETCRAYADLHEAIR